MKRKYYIKSYAINFNTLFRNILTVFTIISIFSIISNFSLGEREFKTNTVTVESNSTLWNIAKQICDENKDLNIQNVMIDIKKINNLNDSSIYVGQTLDVPQY